MSWVFFDILNSNLVSGGSTMPRALSHFADPKFLTLVLLDVFKLWCQRWMQFERNHGGNWTEDEVCQVEEVLIAQVNKLYGTMGRGA
ncbi:MAG: hypothetical protein WCP91_03020, partial [Candidatus Berkelbacteria bacterium]